MPGGEDKNGAQPVDYFSAFDGWGGGAEGTRQVGIPLGRHAASEHAGYNPWAVRTSKALNPGVEHVGPIEGVTPERLGWTPNLFTAGPPCQDVAVGTPNRQGLAGARSGLFYPTADLWDAMGNPHGWFESVASMTPQVKDAISRRLGISPVLLDAAHIGGISRPRLFWPTFPVKPLTGQGQDPRNLIVPERHLFDPFDTHRTDRLMNGTQGYEKNTSKLWKPMRGWDGPKVRAWTRAFGAHGIPYDTVQMEQGGPIQRFTPAAGEMLHGIPEGTMGAAGAPWTQQKMMIGNGWDMGVVRHLLNAYMDHTQPGWRQPAQPQRESINVWTPEGNKSIPRVSTPETPKMTAPAPGSEMFQGQPQAAPETPFPPMQRSPRGAPVGNQNRWVRQNGTLGGPPAPGPAQPVAPPTVAGSTEVPARLDTSARQARAIFGQAANRFNAAPEGPAIPMPEAPPNTNLPVKADNSLGRVFPGSTPETAVRANSMSRQPLVRSLVAGGKTLGQNAIIGGGPAAVSTFLGSLQDGRGVVQSMQDAGWSAAIGTAAMTAMRAFPKGPVPTALLAFPGMDAGNKLEEAVTGNQSGWGGLAGALSVLTPHGKAAALGWGAGSMIEPFVRPVVAPAMNYAVNGPQAAAQGLSRVNSHYGGQDLSSALRKPNLSQAAYGNAKKYDSDKKTVKGWMKK